ncbi:MAG TPA: molybdopterin-dependent oxidoreductase, partial [Pyrinomonadaceae bacterium]|nr:molybdopterin-dependent oxidoreductase [Pyrinomonadaceae bacterium]
SLHLGDTAATAKTAEQLMAIVVCLIAGMGAGAALFAVLRAWEKKSYPAGIIMGVLTGMTVLFITHSLNQSVAVNPITDSLWILLAFLIWGAAFGWAHARLSATDAGGMTDQAEGGEVAQVDRRRFIIRLGGATAVITVVGAGVGALVGNKQGRGVAESKRQLADTPLPNADALVKPAPGTRQELTPLENHYRIDINTIPPAIREENWRLKIDGLVENTLELKLEELRRYEPLEQFITLSCISNPVGGDLIGSALWTGVSLKRLLPDLKLKDTATHLKISSADGFYEIVALDTIKSDERVMLCYAWDGVPLLAEHGFPLRIYIPDHYGMKQPKWIEAIEAIDHAEDGYWVARGWDREARMKATSVIDTIAVDMMVGQANQNTLVPVGGISHAGARGISKVEVRVDDGEWREAQLRTPLSNLTWVVWRYDWPFQKGKHTFTVRCYDGGGTPQIAEEAPPHPSGASGLHSKPAML